MSYRNPLIKTEIPGKKASRVLSKDKKYTSSSYIEDYPLVVEIGEGTVVVDVDGALDIFYGVLSQIEKELL